MTVFQLTIRDATNRHPGTTPMLPRVLETEAMDTPAEAVDYDSMDHGEVNRVFVADLLDAGPKPGQVLDLGTGTVGHVSNVPGLPGFSEVICPAPPSWHVGNAPHEFCGGLHRRPVFGER